MNKFFRIYLSNIFTSIRICNHKKAMVISQIGIYFLVSSILSTQLSMFKYNLLKSLFQKQYLLFLFQNFYIIGFFLIQNRYGFVILESVYFLFISTIISGTLHISSQYRIVPGVAEIPPRLQKLVTRARVGIEQWGPYRLIAVLIQFSVGNFNLKRIALLLLRSLLEMAP